MRGIALDERLEALQLGGIGRHHVVDLLEQIRHRDDLPVGEHHALAAADAEPILVLIAGELRVLPRVEQRLAVLAGRALGRRHRRGLDVIEVVQEVLVADLLGRGLPAAGRRGGRLSVGGSARRRRAVLAIRHRVEVREPVLEIDAAEVVRVRELHALRDAIEDRLFVSRLGRRALWLRRRQRALVDRLLRRRVEHLLPEQDRLHVGEEILLRRACLGRMSGSRKNFRMQNPRRCLRRRRSPRRRRVACRLHQIDAALLHRHVVCRKRLLPDSRR